MNKPATKKQAQDLLIKKLSELQQGIYVEPTDMTVAELLTRWVEDYGKTSWKQTTYEGYMSYIENHIIPEIGSVKISKLKPMHLQRLYTKKASTGRADDRKGGLPTRSVRYIHRIMNEALNMAVKWSL